MSERPAPELIEALDLVRSIEAYCEELRRSGRTDLQDVVAELEATVHELRIELNGIVIGGPWTAED